MDENDINDRIRQMAADGQDQPTRAVIPAVDYMSGALQNALALGTSYLSRRIDIDLQGRLTGSQPSATRPSNQRPVNDHADLTTRAVAKAGGLRIGDMLPWIVAAAIGWMIFKPAKG